MLGLKKHSHSWWFDSHNSPGRSMWLQSTLSELDEKTATMLKLIEEDADSFAQRAEMYYKKRPELINMVEDFYRAHRSLAERFDLLKSESRTRLMTPSGFPFSIKYQLKKLMNPMEKSYDSYSETFDSEECGDSEVDDPEQEEAMGGEEESGESEVEGLEQDEETQVGRVGEEKVSNVVSESEVMKLREEIERLKEENKIQQEQLLAKDEEKREAIRQLSLSIEILKENASQSKKSIVKESSKKRNPFEFNKLKGLFSGKFFGSSEVGVNTTLVAL